MTDLNPAPETNKSSPPPKTPQVDDKAHLCFKREKMVGWLDPACLPSLPLGFEKCAKNGS